MEVDLSAALDLVGSNQRTCVLSGYGTLWEAYPVPSCLQCVNVT